MRRGGFGKVGIIALALVLALAVTGAGFAHWSQTIYINATVETGSVDVCFSDGISNDNGLLENLEGCSNFDGGVVNYVPVDPGDNGLDPSEWQQKGEECNRYTKNVASTEVVGAPCTDTLIITMENTYPCYHPTVFFSIDNTGTIPVDIESIRLTSVDYVAEGTTYVWEVDQDLVACDTWYVDADTGNVHRSPLAEPGDDFTLHLSQLSVCNQIDPAGQIGDKVCGDLDIHVLQNLDNQGRTFSFGIEIVATQWNMVTHPSPEKTLVLPEDTVQVCQHYPGGNSYFDVTLSGVPVGDYSVADGVYPGWCVEFEAGPDCDTVTLHSSLDVSSLPAPYNNQTAWNKINWILNNCDRTYDGGQQYFEGIGNCWTWGPMQRAIWYFMPDAGYAPTDPAGTGAWLCINAAEDHGDFVPGPGQLAAVICLDGSGWQECFIEVDP